MNSNPLKTRTHWARVLGAETSLVVSEFAGRVLLLVSQGGSGAEEAARGIGALYETTPGAGGSKPVARLLLGGKRRGADDEDDGELGDADLRAVVELVRARVGRDVVVGLTLGKRAEGSMESWLAALWADLERALVGAGLCEAGSAVVVR